MRNRKDLINEIIDRRNIPYKEGPEISAFLTLSTSHLREDVCNEFLPSYIHAYPKADYGWFVYVELAPDEHTPESLMACLEFADKHKCSWIMFDRDCEPIDDLLKYEW